MLKKLNVIVVLVICISTLQAQKTSTGNWFIYFGNQALSKKINWHNEVQHRNYNFAGDLQQLMLRTGIGYNLTEKNNNVLLGYGYIRSENYIPNTDIKIANEESRIFQQFIHKHSVGRLFLQHRFRYEERIFAHDFQMRGRYFLAANIPLNKKTMEKNAIYLSFYDEVFLNIKQDPFDRNRAYGALGYVINKNLKFEVGFMAQTTKSSNRNQFQIVLFNSIPFYRD